MRLVLRIGLIAIQIITFFVVTVLGAKTYSYLTAETYDRGLEPRRHFPVIAVDTRSAESSASQYQLIRWGDLKEALRREPQLTFRLPAPEGRFELPSHKNFVPSVRFKVLESTSVGQLVEVVWSEDNYETYVTYVTDGSSVEPRYFRIWGAGSMFIGLVPGLIAAWLLGRLFRRRWHEGADVSTRPKS